MSDFGFDGIPTTGLPAGPAGCRAAILTILFVIMLMLGFFFLVRWMLNDMGVTL